MSDNIIELRILATDEATPPLDAVAATVDDLGKKSGLAGGQLRLFQAAVEGSLRAGLTLNEALKEVAASAGSIGPEAAAAAAALAGALVPAANAADEAVKKLPVSTRGAQQAIRGLGQEIGVTMPRFVTSYLGSLGGVAPIMAAAFAPIAVVGLLEVLGQIPGKLEEGISALRGWGDEAKKQYTAALSFAARMEEAYQRQREAIAKLSAEGLSGPAKVAAEQKINKAAFDAATASVTTLQNRLSELEKQQKALASPGAAGTLGAIGSAAFGGPGQQIQAAMEATRLGLQKEREQVEVEIELLRKKLETLRIHSIELDTEKATLAAKSAIETEKLEEALAIQSVSTREKHDTALLAADKAYYEQRHTLQQASAQETAQAELDLNQKELQIRLKAIDDKIRILKQDPSGNATKIAELQGERIAALDRAAAQELAIGQRLNAEDAKQLDERIKAHVEALNERIQIENHEQELDQERWTKGIEDQQKANEELVSGQRDHATRMIELARQRADFEMQMGLITAQQRIAIDARLNAQEEEMQRAAIEEEITLLDKQDESYLSKKQALENKLKALDDQRNSRMQRDAERVTTEQWRPFQQFFGRMTSGLQNAVGGMLSGYQTFGQAFRNITLGMVTDFAGSLISMGMRWVQHLAMKEAAALGFSSVMKALHIGDAATAEATGAAERTSEVMGAAAVGAANAYAATAAIPIVGPEIAPGVAAGTYAAIAGFAPAASAAGGWDMPNSDSFAFLHAKEMVLPREHADVIRHMAQGGGSAGGGGGENHQHIHYHAAAGETPSSMEANMAALKRMHKNGRVNFLLAR